MLRLPRAKQEAIGLQVDLVVIHHETMVIVGVSEHVGLRFDFEAGFGQQVASELRILVFGLRRGGSRCIGNDFAGAKFGEPFLDRVPRPSKDGFSELSIAAEIIQTDAIKGEDLSLMGDR